MNLFLRGRSRYPDNLPPPRLPPYGSVPINSPVEQYPLNESPPRDGILLDNSQTGLSEPLGELPTLFVRVLKDGLIFELPYDVAIERDDVKILYGYERLGHPLSLDHISNNSAVHPQPHIGLDSPTPPKGLEPIIDKIGIPESCPILNDPDLIKMEVETGIRQRFPRNDYCSKCLLECPYSERIEDFKAWLFGSRKHITIVEGEVEDRFIRLAFPKKHRFCKSYQKKVCEKFNQLTPYLLSEYRFMFFLTLTVNPTFDLIYTMHLISKQFEALINILKKRLKRKGVKMGYLKVYEPTEKGIIHVHLIIFVDKLPKEGSKPFLIDKKELDEIWGLGYTWLGMEYKGKRYIWLPLNKRHSEVVIRYVLKYISKAHKNLLFASLIWRKGKGGGLRSFTTSRDISSAMTFKDPPKGFVVVYRGWVWDVPDVNFPLTFNGHTVDNVGTLEELLDRWWENAGG